MPNLKCHEYGCGHNHCTHCSKGTLSVSRDAYCNDYFRRSDDDKENYDYEFSYEHAMSLSQDEHRIVCSDRACINNASGECAASYIRVDRRDRGARCCQVREK